MLNVGNIKQIIFRIEFEILIALVNDRLLFFQFSETNVLFARNSLIGLFILFCSASQRGSFGASSNSRHSRGGCEEGSVPRRRASCKVP